MVAYDRNLLHGALWLLVSLFGVAGLFVMLAAPFLAAVQVLVYMGVIVILIIFAIMLTRQVMGVREMPNNQWPVALAMAAIAFLVIALILSLASSNNLLLARQVQTAVVTAISRRLARRWSMLVSTRCRLNWRRCC